MHNQICGFLCLSKHRAGQEHESRQVPKSMQAGPGVCIFAYFLIHVSVVFGFFHLCPKIHASGSKVKLTRNAVKPNSSKLSQINVSGGLLHGAISSNAYGCTCCFCHIDKEKDYF